MTTKFSLKNDTISVGMIGCGGRGSMLLDTLSAIPDVLVTAVCDRYEDRVSRAVEKQKNLRGNTPIGTQNYREVLAMDQIDAVVIATPWDEHIRMTIDALHAGKATAMEVGGAYDLEECYALIRAAEETKTPMMFMENCCFDRFELLATSLCRAGKLGEIVHCHGAYSHDLRNEILGGSVRRHYRLDNYLRRNSENYPTHELGPIARLLNINRGNRMVSLVSVASKAAGLTAFSKTDKNPDPSLAGRHFAQGDVVSTIITCAGGETITLTLDTSLPKYYSREFTIRGTKGLCQQENNLILLEDEHNIHAAAKGALLCGRYQDNANDYEAYLPDIWRNVTDEQLKLGHGGMDYLEFVEFFSALREGRDMPIDVYDAAAWMSVTALSERSIAQGGAPQAIPDFTGGKWITRASVDVVPLPCPSQEIQK